MISTTSLRRDWLSNVRGDVLAGIVVALALIPEAIGFSIIAGVDPRVGLYASFTIAVLTAFVGGRPGMISAATAAIAVLIGPLVRDHGVEYLFAATVVMGGIQIVAGLLEINRLMQFVSRSVITGFVNALAILIFLAQLPELTGVTWVTYALVAAGLGVIYLFPLVTRAVPSPLVAIVALTAVAIGFDLPVNRVGDMGELPSALPWFALPAVPFNLETLRIVLPYSATMAAVGLLESLLTAQIVDDLTDTPSDKRREAMGQGVANLVTGFFGGMGGCAMIGQSVINVKSGGFTRLSTLVAGSVLLFLIVVLGPFVARIPMPALVAVMIMVSVGTFSWTSIKKLRSHPSHSSIVMVSTVLVVVWTHDLAQGVLVGVLLITYVPSLTLWPHEDPNAGSGIDFEGELGGAPAPSGDAGDETPALPLGNLDLDALLSADDDDSAKPAEPATPDPKAVKPGELPLGNLDINALLEAEDDPAPEAKTADDDDSGR